MVVNTKTQEFDYPSGEENIYVHYEGTGGVQVTSLFRKALFALRFKSLKLFLSGDTSRDSRIMFYRNIEERVQRVNGAKIIVGTDFLKLAERVQ